MEIKEVRLNDKMKQLIGKSIGINIKKTFEYVPEAYRQKDENGKYEIPQENWPRFTLRLISGMENKKIQDLSTSTKYENDPTTGEVKPKIDFREGDAKYHTLKLALKKWNFLHDQDFNVMKWDSSNLDEDGNITDEALNCLSSSLVDELWMAVVYNLKLSEEELMGLE